MSDSNIKIVIVEDNGLAQANLRNHLLDMGFTKISCYSNGRELRRHIKTRVIDLLLMDYHLGQNINGIEVVQELQKCGLVKNTTSVLFLTYDRLPMVVGQIVDLHPDALIVKPYTIKNLEKNIRTCLDLRNYLMPILKLMDEESYAQALAVLEQLIEENAYPRKLAVLIKLRARLLIKLGRYQEAERVYKKILAGCDKIIWAKWGVIQSIYLDGRINRSESLLLELTEAQLTHNKACEWLARICIENNQYGKAEEHMEKIREGEMSIPAARLKAYIYQAQEKGDDAINLLEKKRESNRSIRERFDELSLDLARCYLTQAEDKAPNERKSLLQVAKLFIGSAGRKDVDQQLNMKKAYMYSVAAVLAGDYDKANSILTKPEMANFDDAEVSTMTDAVFALQATGKSSKAKEILVVCQQKLAGIDDGNEKTISSMLVAKIAQTLGTEKPQALALNKEGLELYVKKHYLEAIKCFYQAYLLFPREIAFSLNLLQSMVDAQLANYEEINTLAFLQELQKRPLSDVNQKRLDVIAVKVDKDKTCFAGGEQSK
ncbi:MAG: DNA-binding NarL/FixJ family response regulator [Paraglaciecola sp.]|jgi:DNA-binding NarL/FixJ family response regulator